MSFNRFEMTFFFVNVFSGKMSMKLVLGQLISVEFNCLIYTVKGGRHMKKKNVVLLLALLGLVYAGLKMKIAAVSTESSSWQPPQTNKVTSLYDKGMQADKSGDYQNALNYFQQALRKDRNNPDIVNMIAHSERNLGMINEAIDDYWKALKLRPRFPEAREYMGEAYIQAILKELDTLKSYGADGEEQRNQLIKAFKDAAAGIQ